MIKNAEAPERMEKIDTLVVNKTGTLTEGRPQVVSIVPAGGHSSSITDMADTDGDFVYAIVDGRIEIANRLPQSRASMAFGTFEIHSPGRLTFITNCGGSAAVFGETIIARRLHVTERLFLVERR